MNRFACFDYVEPIGDPFGPYVPPRVRSWLRSDGIGEERLLDVHFAAGAVLTRLDPLIARASSGLGVWLERLALRAAANGAKSIGLFEDEAALRDQWIFRGAGEMTPAVRVLGICRDLASARVPQIEAAGEWGAWVARERWVGPGNEEVIAGCAAALAGIRNPVAAAAAVMKAAMSSEPEAEILSWGLADSVLAWKIGWGRIVPLIGSGEEPRKLRRVAMQADGRELEIALGRHCVASAYDAIGGYFDLARRAEHLLRTVEAAKVRTVGLQEVLREIMMVDAVKPRDVKGLHERVARRLFCRLADLTAVRELTGREYYRLYGL